MELSVFPYELDCLYAVPWGYYRREEGCLLAEGEKVEDYAPYLDSLRHLRENPDPRLWPLLVQDAVKETLTCLLLTGFPEGEDLQGKLEELRKLLLVVPEHPLARTLTPAIERGGVDPARRAAEVVALWHQMEGASRPQRLQDAVETLPPVETCLPLYPAWIREILTELEEALKTCVPYLEGAYLHGSLATLDFIPGASDLDVLYLLNQRTSVDPTSLLKLQAVLRELRPLFYRIDPLQHHGPYLITPGIQAQYLESYLPLAVWKNSRPFFGPRRLSFSFRQSHYHDHLWFRRSVQYYRRCLVEGKPVPSGYDAKLLVSMASLLPAIAYTHVHGAYCTKGEAFEWAKGSFPERPIQEWISRLTRIRRESLFRPGLPDLNRADEPGPLNGSTAGELKEAPFAGPARFCDRVLGMDVRTGLNGTFQQYSNFPRSPGVDLYDRVLEKLTREARSIPGVTRLLVSGTFSHPGISDLDLVVVTEDVLPQESARRIEGLYDGLEEQEKALAMHPPMAVLPERLLPEAPWLFPLSLTRAAYGEMPRFASPAPGERSLLALVLLTDFAVLMNGRLFQEMVRRRKIDVRLLLNELWGLKYAVGLLENAGGDRTPHVPFLQDVITLRDEWAGSPSPETLPLFLERGAESLIRIQRQIGGIWRERTAAVLPAPFGFRAASSGVDFEEDPAASGCHREGDELVVRLPLPFALPLLHYSRLQGPLSGFLRRRLPVKGRLQDGPLGEVLDRRGNRMNEHFRYLLKTGLRFGFFAPFHFGWQIWKRLKARENRP